MSRRTPVDDDDTVRPVRPVTIYRNTPVFRHHNLDAARLEQVQEAYLAAQEATPVKQEAARVRVREEKQKAEKEMRKLKEEGKTLQSKGNIDGAIEKYEEVLRSRGCTPEDEVECCM